MVTGGFLTKEEEARQMVERGTQFFALFFFFALGRSS